MDCYKLRIDYTPSKDNKYREMENKYFSSYVRVLEDVSGENHHYHYYVETTSSSVALRQYIRKEFGSGNGTYSLKKVEKHPIEYIAYMYKTITTDNNVGSTFVTYNMPVDVIKEAKAYDIKVKQSLKNKSRGMVSQLENYLIDKYGSVTTNKENLVRSVVQFYVEQNKSFDDYTILRVCNSLRCKYDVKYMDRFVNNIIDKMV